MFGCGCGGVMLNSIKSLYAELLQRGCFVFGVHMFFSRDWPRGGNVISRNVSKTSDMNIIHPIEK